MVMDPLSLIGTAKKVDTLFASDGVLAAFAAHDMAAAAESIKSARTSTIPREHYLSARNHLEACVIKRKAALKGYFGEINKPAYMMAAQDLLYALALKAIMDFYLRDPIVCSSTLDEVEQYGNKIEAYRIEMMRPVSRHPSIPYLIAVAFALPRMVYRGLISKPDVLSNPAEFCAQMRSMLDEQRKL